MDSAKRARKPVFAFLVDPMAVQKRRLRPRLAVVLCEGDLEGDGVF